MDVVNGKFVAARPERGTEGWSGLQPSRARVGEGGVRESIHTNPDLRSGVSLRGCPGREWAPSWAPTWATSCFGDVDQSPAQISWGGAAPGSIHGPQGGLALAPGAARLSHGCGVWQPQPAGFHRPGWERSSSCFTAPSRGNGQRQWHFNAPPCSETKFDEEMTMYESQITRTVSGHFSKVLGQEKISTPVSESTAVSITSMDEGKGDKHSHSLLERSASGVGSTLLRTSFDLKRKRSINFGSENDQADCGWTHPLRLLIRKGLSSSDVGDLGRIVIPKKLAESQFPHIDSKEGTLLQMEDYSTPKRWFFRFKFWSNNKTRMYVLENTGEFIKYHSLKENDNFVVYEDRSRKMVAHGHKGTDLDSTLAILQGSNGESSSDKAEGEGPASAPALA